MLRQDNSNQKMSFEDYCMINSCTDKGLQDIATYNGFEDKWADIKQTFDERTSMASKRFQSIKLYAKCRTKREYHLDPIEGGHRKAAVFQASFCAQLNPEDGFISNCLTYTPDNFRIANLTPDESITVKDIMGSYHSVIKQGSMNNGFFSGKSIVDVIYLSKKDISVTDFLEACQICSDGIGREKRNSATKDVFVEIAKCTETFLHKMSDNELMNRPCLESIVYSSGNKFPKTILNAKELPRDLNWRNRRTEIRNVLPLTALLYTDDCENYCKAPFDKDNCDNFMNKLRVPCVSDETDNDEVSIEPPFVISYESMAVDAGQGTNQRATAEMVNKWYLLPKFIHILVAHKRNISIVEAARNPGVAGLVLYAMRHHVHNNGFSNIGGHACMFMYGLHHTQCLVDNQTQVILAALYLTEMVNATLTTIHDDDKCSSESSQEDWLVLRRKRLVKETTEILLLFSTLNIYANNPGIDRMISELGKIYIL